MLEKKLSLLPDQIEKRSFEIIKEELSCIPRVIEPCVAPIVFRVIHTTADFDYADNLVFSEGAIEKALDALTCDEPPLRVITDTTMARAGIDKTRLAALGGEVVCFIGDENVGEIAQKSGETRSHVAVDKAFGYLGGERAYPLSRTAFVVGNAPTALNRLCEHIESRPECEKPAFIVGVPVGFVNVVASKERLMALDVPYITARGRKGGSNVAAAIMNALIRMALEKRDGKKDV